MNNPPYRLAHSGVTIDLLHPQLDRILLTDIAHHLALLCRFGGACDAFYSVAQHCCLVATLAERAGELPAVVQWAAVHDAPEYVLDDVGTPIKHLMRASGDETYDRLHAIWDGAMAQRFGLRQFQARVKFYDTAALLIERRDNGPHGISDDEFLGRDSAPWRAAVGATPRIVPWVTSRAERNFLRLCARLELAQ